MQVAQNVPTIGFKNTKNFVKIVYFFAVCYTKMSAKIYILLIFDISKKQADWKTVFVKKKVTRTLKKL